MKGRERKRLTQKNLAKPLNGKEKEGGPDRVEKREGGSQAAGEALKVSLTGIAAEPRTREKESSGTDAEALRRGRGQRAVCVCA